MKLFNNYTPHPCPLPQGERGLLGFTILKGEFPYSSPHLMGGDKGEGVLRRVYVHHI